MSIIIDNQSELVYGTYDPPMTYEVKKKLVIMNYLQDLILTTSQKR
ncbi:hypothetical protein [Staphylococcus shinii]|nr:hypothetical protein [Staphylococcus shinii]